MGLANSCSPLLQRHRPKRMVGMRIGRMGVIVVMVSMSMLVIMCVWNTLQLERAVCLADQSFNVVMVAFLGCTHFCLKTQNLRAVFAQAAVHGGVTGEDLPDALHKCINHRRVVIQIGCLGELDLRMAGRHFIRD